MTTGHGARPDRGGSLGGRSICWVTPSNLRHSHKNQSTRARQEQTGPTTHHNAVGGGGNHNRGAGCTADRAGGAGSAPHQQHGRGLCTGIGCTSARPDGGWPSPWEGHSKPAPPLKREHLRGREGGWGQDFSAGVSGLGCVRRAACKMGHGRAAMHTAQRARLQAAEWHARVSVEGSAGGGYGRRSYVQDHPEHSPDGRGMGAGGGREGRAGRQGAGGREGWLTHRHQSFEQPRAVWDFRQK